jgi:hypothetical protein
VYPVRKGVESEFACAWQQVAKSSTFLGRRTYSSRGMTERADVSGRAAYLEYPLSLRVSLTRISASWTEGIIGLTESFEAVLGKVSSDMIWTGGVKILGCKVSGEQEQ